MPAKGKPPAPEFYVADSPLRISGEGWALAYEPGDQVPAEHVKRFGWHDQVSSPDKAPDTEEE